MKKGCRVTTKGADLYLKYPHSEGMHKSKKLQVEESTSLDEEEDEMMELFD